MRALRASSLAAVTSLVWSTSENPISCDSFRTSWRASTMSCSLFSGDSPLVVVMVADRVYLPTQLRHAPLDVERGRHSGERQAELHQRDRDGRLHAHQHGLRAEDLGHA